MDFIKNIVKDKINLLALFIALVGAYLLFPAYFENPIFPIQPSEHLWMSLDPSWVSALNYVNLKNVIWGKEFAFTYGPLSYLSTRVGWGQNRVAFLLFDLFYFLNFFILFFTSFIKSKNKILTGVLILTIAIILPVYFGASNSFILLAFLLYWIRSSLDNNLVVNYIFQISILVLLFFIKLNTGLVCFILYTVALFYKTAIKKDNRILLFIYFIAPFVLIYMFSFSLNVSVGEYVKSGISIIGGFNEIMYLPGELLYKKLAAILIVLSSSLILLYKIYLFKNENIFKHIVVLFLYGSSIFILYKQAFVRADDSHILEFFNFALLLLFCIYDFHTLKFDKILTIPVILIMIVCVYFVNELKPDFIQLDNKFKKANYVDGFEKFTKISGVKLFPNSNQLPQRVISKVGLSTIDSYPWNTQILLENKLNFYPRPVFQSYTAYTKELEELNFNYYNSIKAPKYVLYDYGSVDDRYPLFDEPRMNLILEQNYKCVDTFTINKRLNLLLERKSEKKVKLTKIKEYAMYIDAPLIPKEGIFYEVYLYNSVKGKLVSLFEHSPEVALEIQTEDGNKRKFKTSKSLLESGLFSTNFLSNTSDFFNKMERKEVSDAIKIKAYFFQPMHVSSFKEKIRVKEYKISN